MGIIRAGGSKKILFVCGSYSPTPYANGICVLRIQEALFKEGYVSDVLCFGEAVETEPSPFGDIYHVDSELSKRTSVRRVRRILYWPVTDIRIVRRMQRKLRDLLNMRDYACVICALRPIEGALACAMTCDYILYELDSITNNGDNLYGLWHLLRYRAFAVEKLIYRKASYILHLKCHEAYYSQEKYRKYRYKSEFVDIPHLVHPDFVQSAHNRKPIRMMFTGTLENVRNSPEYACQLLVELEKQMPVVCDFFSKGCDDYIAEMAREYPDLIVRNGYVSQERLSEAKENADVWLSIGFRHTGSVTSIPSKVFEYMSTGLPIIHIVGGKNDTAVPYLEQYGNALLLYEEDGMEENIEKLARFIQSNIDIRVDLDELRKVLPMNTPEWTAAKIISRIGDTADAENPSCFGNRRPFR